MLAAFLLFFGPTTPVQLTKNVKNFNVQDGLIQSQCRSLLLKEEKGELWVGTGAGLSIFNGFTFANYTHRDGLHRNDIWALCKVGEQVWLGHGDGGLTQYSENGFRGIAPPQAPKRQVFELVPDRFGRIWVGRDQSHKLFYYDMEKDLWQETMFPFGAPQAIAIHEDVLWVGSADHVMTLSLSGDLSQYEKPFPLANVSHFSWDENGLLWMGTSFGQVFTWDGEALVDKTEVFGTVGIPISWMDHHGDLVVGTQGGGLWTFNSNQVRDAINTGNGLNSDFLYRFVRDQYGFVWVGTSNGLDLIRPNPFRAVRFPGDIGHKTVWCFFVDDANSIFIGTDNGVLNLQTRADWAFSALPKVSSLNLESIRGINRDNHGRLWACGDGIGLIRYGPENPSQIGIKDGLPSDRLVGLLKAKDGNFWLGTRKVGVFQYDPIAGQVLEWIHVNPGLNETVFSIKQAVDGQIWWGARHAGLVSFDPQSKKRSVFGRNSGILDPWIYGIDLYTEGFLVVGEQGGCYQFVENRFEPIELPCTENTTYYSVISQADKVLVGTENGMVRLDPEDGSCWQFQQGQGFLGIETNVNAVMEHEGSYWFGTINGVTIYDPDSVQIWATATPQIFMSRISSNNQDLDQSHLKVNSDQSEIMFQFASLSASGQDWLEFRTMLSGFDESWEPVHKNPLARYSGLKPGSYAFRVQGRFPNRPWGEELRVPFTVHLPYYRTAWFYVLVLSILGLVFWGQGYLSRLRQEQLRKEVQHRTKDLEDALVAANQARSAKQDFLATMSHEIRTPINGILGMAEQLKRKVDDPDLSDYAEIIHRSSQSLLVILNDILDLSKIEAGKMRIRKVHFELEPVLEGVLKLYYPQAHEKGLKLQMFWDANLPQFMESDPDRIQQVLLNLVSNAIKFTDRGVVQIQGSLVDGELLICISDTGRGLQKEELDKVFDAFTQGESFAHRSQGGTGLGLAIVQQLIHLLGGHLVAESELGKGSRFGFKMPIEGANHGYTETLNWFYSLQVKGDHHLLKDQLLNWGMQEATNQTPEVAISDSLDFLNQSEAKKKVLISHLAEPIEGISVVQEPLLPRHFKEIILGIQSKKRTQPGTQSMLWRKASILLVDDNRVNLMVASKLLTDLPDLEISKAESGSKCLELVQHSPFDIIFMDCQMPEMDGYEATAAIRKLDMDQPVIIALTANALAGDLELCLNRGMDDYLSKPVTQIDLVRVLNKWLGPNPARRQFQSTIPQA